MWNRLCNCIKFLARLYLNGGGQCCLLMSSLLLWENTCFAPGAISKGLETETVAWLLVSPLPLMQSPGHGQMWNGKRLCLSIKIYWTDSVRQVQGRLLLKCLDPNWRFQLLDLVQGSNILAPRLDSWKLWTLILQKTKRTASPTIRIHVNIFYILHKLAINSDHILLFALLHIRFYDDFPSPFVSANFRTIFLIQSSTNVQLSIKRVMLVL